jgi:hypothetical protein
MSDAFQGIRLKIKRTADHLQQLNDEVNRFLDGDPYTPAINLDRKTWEFSVHMRVKVECDPMWSIIAGEVLHNCRSALDHCVYQLVILNTGHAPPTKSSSRKQFPIFLDSGEFDRNPQMLVGVGDEATRLIKSLQPFATGEGVASPLWHLKKLSDFDKHRTIHLTGALLERFNVQFPNPQCPMKVNYKVNRDVGPFADNTVFVVGQFISDGPPYSGEVKVNAKLKTNVAFHHETPVVGTRLFGPTLVAISHRVIEAISRIGKECFKVEVWP